MEEALEVLHRRRKSHISKTNALMRKAYTDLPLSSSMELRQRLSSERNTINTEIKNREASLEEWKHTKVMEMGALFIGLLECSEKGTVVATLGHAIIGNLSIGTTQPRLPQAHFSGKFLVGSLVTEAELKVEAEQPTNEDRTGGISSQKVTSKQGTDMDNQRGTTNTLNQDPHHARPINNQHARLVDQFRVHSSYSVPTTSTSSIVGVFVPRFPPIALCPKTLRQRHSSRKNPSPPSVQARRALPTQTSPTALIFQSLARVRTHFCLFQWPFEPKD